MSWRDSFASYRRRWAVLMTGLISAGSIAAVLPCPAIANALAPAVQLLVPLESGHELELLLPKAPQAQLVRVNNRDFVSLGRFQDARVAYRLGRTFQRHTQLPFELAYDPGHPDTDGTWLASESQGTRIKTVARRVSGPSKTAGGKNLNPGRAELLGGTLVAGRTQDQWLNPTHTLPPLPPAATEPHHRQQSLIQAVAIAPVTRPSLATVNPQLHYLYARLSSTSDLLTLKQHATVTEVTELNGQFLARVGVFTSSRQGRRLLRHQADRLAAIGYDLEVNHVTI